MTSATPAEKNDRLRIIAWFTLGGTLVLAFSVAMIIATAYASSNAWGHRLNPDKGLIEQNDQLRQQVCLDKGGNWSTPNGQAGRCVLKP